MAFDDVEVVARGGVRLVERGDALAQMIERLGEAVGFEHARPPRMASSTVSPGTKRWTKLDGRRIAEAGGQLLQSGALCEEMEEGFRGAVEHQRLISACGPWSPAGVRSSARSSGGRCGRGPGNGRCSRTMIPRVSSGSAASSIACRPLVTPRFARRAASSSIRRSMRVSRSRCAIEGRIAAAKTAVGSTLYSAADAGADQPRQLEHVAARLRVAVAGRNRRAEGDERARPVADGVPHHLGQLARERPLPLLDALPREDVIFEHQVVGDRRPE